MLTLQNGVDSTETLARVLGAACVIGGVAQIASVIAEPGVIRHTGTMARFVLGELNGERSERVGALAGALRAAAVDHQVSADIRRDIWDKMVFLATFAGLTALLRLPIGPIRGDADSARHATRGASRKRTRSRAPRALPCPTASSSAPSPAAMGCPTR